MIKRLGVFATEHFKGIGIDGVALSGSGPSAPGARVSDPHLDSV